MRLVIAASAALMLFAATPAVAEVSQHCQQAGYCLFSGSRFDGTKVSVPTGGGCRPVESLGIDAARSAARGFGDGYALELFSDSACANRIGTVSKEISGISAETYRLTMIPV
jgi:hypothetical protein